MDDMNTKISTCVQKGKKWKIIFQNINFGDSFELKMFMESLTEL